MGPKGRLHQVAVEAEVQQMVCAASHVKVAVVLLHVCGAYAFATMVVQRSFDP